MKPVYKHVLVKMSGEMLGGEAGQGIATDELERFARELGQVRELGVQVSVIIGGGNIFRGLAGSARGMDRATADYMGMLATVINALALQDALERQGVHTRVQSAIEMRSIAEPYIRRRAMRHGEPVHGEPSPPRRLRPVGAWQHRSGRMLRSDRHARHDERGLIANAILPRMMTAATASRAVGGSSSTTTAAAAVITGTDSWTSAARVAPSDGTAAYHSV
jgi:hypothetical protein